MLIEEKIRATRPLLTLGATMMSIWIALSSVAVFLTSEIAGWLFLGCAAFSVFVVIRRQMCGSCYYCVSCTKGFAKTSKLFLGGNHIPGISKSSAVAMTVYLYVLLTAVPGAFLTSSLMHGFDFLRALLLVGLLAVAVYNVAAHSLNLQK